jgi:hypothetical protein
VTLALAIIGIVIAGFSLGVAFRAASTAHKARVWQRERDEQRFATRVRVEMAHTAERMLGGPINYALELDVINDGEPTEYVTAAFVVAVRDADSRNIRKVLPVYGDPTDLQEPRELRPRTRLTFTATPRPDQVEWMRVGMVGVVAGVRCRGAVGSAARRPRAAQSDAAHRPLTSCASRR